MVRREQADPNKPVEAHMLFGSFADKTAVDLCRNTHGESARVRAF
jgi:hypothetical protein